MKIFRLALLVIGLLFTCTKRNEAPKDFYVKHKNEIDHIRTLVDSFDKIYSCRKMNSNQYLLYVRNDTTNYYVGTDSLNLLFWKHEKLAVPVQNLKFSNLLEYYQKVDQSILFGFKDSSYMYVYSKKAKSLTQTKGKNSPLEESYINSNWYAFKRKSGPF